MGAFLLIDIIFNYLLLKYKEEIEIREKDKSILNEDELELLLEVSETLEMHDRKKEFSRNKKELKEMGHLQGKRQKKKGRCKK